jgi:mono/diheme cytochrome c family protein
LIKRIAATTILVAALASLGACDGGGEKAPPAKDEAKAAEPDKAAGDTKDDEATPAAEAPGQGAADAGPRGDVAKGEVVYGKYCVACHQKDGKGMSGAMGANFVDNKAHLAKPDSELLKNIAEGMQGPKSVMPPQKDLLDEQQRKDALAYIREAFGDK